jgi:hypothetical protein
MLSVTNKLIMLSVIRLTVVAPLDWGFVPGKHFLIDPSPIFVGKAWPYSMP